ncbi:FAD-dependent monooxygenase [Azohydromonas caseinilytica]|uniref:2-octaprenyl-3-methyl-6-methoxy-1,4-benzoquinol hydroxylase n=1 Tax=Azohydromonas caseinilytica TaxID=2728836 RepID=A0A848FA73_9BURK|nr:FAD-dependent monooxygenase [Azohydromonas caseinilytica]NML15110.1 2-octaprenyl-3-methyl-6-methoxy-1,4-benzoquinol hydroxylase [Azohydromonas caseinilytica]
MTSYDIAVRGAGAVGRSLALALSRQGLSVALLEAAPRQPQGPDVRTYALNAQAVGLLRGLKVWDALPADAATAVSEMLVHGDAHDSQLEFSAWSQCVDALAWIVDAQALDEALATAVRFAPHVTALPADTPVQAPLSALCEGKHSAAREALGIGFHTKPYGHTAVAARLVADRPHEGVARQWFRSPDILALLPFDRPRQGCSYGLVWSMPTERAQAMQALPDAEFEAALNEACGAAAGHLALSGPRVGWPLQLSRAERVCGPGWVLVGDAAHVVHPLSGQGLNLGLGDVEALARVIAERESWRPLSDEKLLRRYARARAVPTLAMQQLTDGLLHLFEHDTPVLRELRNRGLNLVNQLTPLKRWLAGRALGT